MKLNSVDSPTLKRYISNLKLPKPVKKMLLGKVAELPSDSQGDSTPSDPSK
jgi:hypothetical protein